MVHISDGNSSMGGHVKSNYYYLICLKHLIWSRTVTNPVLFKEIPIFLYVYATCSELPSNMSTMPFTLVRARSHSITSAPCSAAILNYGHIYYSNSCWISFDYRLRHVLICAIDIFDDGGWFYPPSFHSLKQ